MAPCLLLLTLSKVLQVSTDYDTVHSTAWLTLLLNWRACSPIETFSPLKHHCNNVTLRGQCYLHPWVTHWLMSINFSLLCFTYCRPSWTWALELENWRQCLGPHIHKETHSQVIAAELKTGYRICHLHLVPSLSPPLGFWGGMRGSS